MSDVRFGSWSTAESLVTIEYSLVVIEEIRHEVADGFQKLSRGGVEVGGILYGTREGRGIRVTAMRPFSCEHLRGPSLLLSDADRQLLKEQIEHASSDPRLADLICLGWFCSHTRSEILLTESDREIYEEYFSAPWHVTLVVRPGRAGNMRAGFFVREPDGSVQSESSYLEFDFPDRLAGVFDHTPRIDRLAGRRHPSYFRDGGAAAAAAPALEQPAPVAAVPPPQFLPAPTRKLKWPWLVAWALAVIALAGAGLRYYVWPPHVELLALAVLDHDGQLQISWNRDAKAIAQAVRGALIVTDGQAPRTLPLSTQDLAKGTFTYPRNSNDVQVRMSVEGSGGERTEEATSFIKAGPAKTETDASIKALEQERDDLQAEVDQLKGQNSKQAERIQQLERNLKILEARLGIQ